VKKIIFFLVGILVISTSVMARDYQYISAAELQKRIETNKQGLLLDIQVEDEFSEHHIENAVATYAYPVKSDQDKQKLQAVVKQAKASKEPVTIICPRGGGGAKRTYDYLKEQGVSESRLLILEGGQAEWRY
jgi:thiosulfate/3-mercaptopyruvate sulfurtransferase